MNVSEILGSLKSDWKGKKVMEHHQTVSRPHNGTQVVGAAVWCAYTNF